MVGGVPSASFLDPFRYGFDLRVHLTSMITLVILIVGSDCTRFWTSYD